MKYEKNNIPWNKDMRMSNTFRKKISKAHIGISHKGNPKGLKDHSAFIKDFSRYWRNKGYDVATEFDIRPDLLIKSNSKIAAVEIQNFNIPRYRIEKDKVYRKINFFDDVIYFPLNSGRKTLTQKYNIYLAAGWFTNTQQNTYVKICKLLNKYKKDFNVYYPKDESAIKQNTITTARIRKKTFLNNLKAIKESTLVICSTEDKDPGSLFEAGYAYRYFKPIIYVCFSLKNKSFNLMLQESSIAVATTEHELTQILDIIRKENPFSVKLQQFQQNQLTE